MKNQRKHPRVFSLEFFPPKTDQGVENLRLSRDRLATLKPAFMSVTFGAGGSTRTLTLETVLDIQRDTKITGVPHISCIASTKENIRDLLQQYQSHDIARLVVLRGDIPQGLNEIGEFHYANKLVEFIRQETGSLFHIDVAAYPEVHPQATSATDDINHFARKVDAGANGAITQYFYNPDAYFHFVDECERRNLNIPIVPGIMPITNFAQLANFSDNCGAEIPRWIRQRLAEYGDDLQSIRAFGIEIVTAMCERLIAAGAPGLHFYTLNKAEATVEIWNHLGLSDFS